MSHTLKRINSPCKYKGDDVMSEGLPTKDQQWADFQRKQQQQQARERCFREMLDTLKAWVDLDDRPIQDIAGCRSVLAQRSAALIVEAEQALERID